MNKVFTFITNPIQDRSYAREACGVLPHWVHNYTLDPFERDLVNYMQDVYGFGKLFELSGTIEDGKYVSPHEEDEPLDYIAKSEIKEGTVYYFPYAIIALPVKGGHFITRMD